MITDRPTFPPPCQRPTFRAMAARARRRWPGPRFTSRLECLDCFDPTMTDFAHATS
jgi:hypothetical protein